MKRYLAIVLLLMGCLCLFGCKKDKPEEYQNTISKEAKKHAKEFPAVSGNLPDWKGTNVVNKAEFGWVWVSTYRDPSKEKDTGTTRYTEELVNEIQDAGFNYVRLAIDTRFIFTEEDFNNFEHAGSEFCGSIGTVNTTQLENLDQVIEWCIERDIHVCIDCHSTPGGLMIGGDEEASRLELFTKDSDAQKLFLRYWEIIANRYDDVDTKALSFNLYNEPPHFLVSKENDYIDLMNQATNIIQAVTPERLIVIDALDYATIGLEHPDKLVAANYIIGFHIYANECQNEEIKHLNMEDCESELRTRLKEYDDYSKDKNVRWMLQEYGCVTSLDKDDIIAYNRFVVNQCKELQVSYCHYAFSAGVFSLVLYSEDEDFSTEGVNYDMTPSGHRIYRELADVLTK